MYVVVTLVPGFHGMFKFSNILGRDAFPRFSLVWDFEYDEDELNQSAKKSSTGSNSHHMRLHERYNRLTPRVLNFS